MPCLEGMNSEKRLRRIPLVFEATNSFFAQNWHPAVTTTWKIWAGAFFSLKVHLKSFAVVIDVLMIFDINSDDRVKGEWSHGRGFFGGSRWIALPGTKMENEMLAASSRDPWFGAPPKWSWDVFDWIDALVSLNFILVLYQTEIHTHILVSDCNFYLAKVAIFRFLFKWMSCMISLGYQNHPSILDLHVWDAYLDPLPDSRCFFGGSKFCT